MWPSLGSASDLRKQKMSQSLDDRGPAQACGHKYRPELPRGAPRSPVAQASEWYHGQKRLRCGRKRDRECGPVAGFTRYGDRSALRLDQMLDDGEPQSGP